MALNPGDIAIVGYNADGADNFSFVALVNIPAGEQITFTDDSLLSTGLFRGGEGHILWTAPAEGVSSGTVITIDGTPAASLGTVVETGDFDFSSSGDQVLAYQGSIAAPTFIFGLNNNGAAVWQSGAPSDQASALPSGLTDGVNAVAITEIDNAVYTGPTSGTRAELLAAIVTASNWVGSDTENQTATASFGVNETVLGTAGDDTLDGGTGADTMIGGTGNDLYYVDNINDVTTEDPSAGLDRVISTVTWTLSDNFERLFLIGTDDIDGTGNDLDNALAGNAGDNTLISGLGNDTLNGGAGADTMIGGQGDDRYVVNVATDQTVEVAGEGVDAVYAGITWTLASDVENLIMTGSGNIDGYGNISANNLIGNAGDNSLFGNEGNDVLRAGAGDDTLVGGVGADVLFGGTGADRFVLDLFGDRDVIRDFEYGVDKLAIDGTIFTVGSVPGPLAAEDLVISDRPVAPIQGFGAFLFDTDNGVLSWDGDGLGGAAAVQVARLNLGGTLSVTDFDVFFPAG